MMEDAAPMKSDATGQVTVTREQEPRLASGGQRLADEFAVVFARETIDCYLDECYVDLAGRATVPGFLPLIAERFARQRLRALAHVQGLTW